MGTLCRHKKIKRSHKAEKREECPTDRAKKSGKGGPFCFGMALYFMLEAWMRSKSSANYLW